MDAPLPLPRRRLRLRWRPHEHEGPTAPTAATAAAAAACRRRRRGLVAQPITLLLLAAFLLLLSLTTPEAFSLHPPPRRHRAPTTASSSASSTTSSGSAPAAGDAGGIPASILPRGLSDPYDGPLKDLVDSGVLTVIRRRPDYRDRRGEEYVEPQEIYLVATAHTSAASAEAAARVIEEVRPHSVVLEMCKSRSGLTALNDSRLLEEVGFPTLMRTALFGVGGTDLGGSDDDNDDDAASSRAALERSLRLAGGRVPLLFQYCLTWAVKELAGLLKVQFGAEFRYARAAAERVGAQVVLGDRPIELTLKRAWAAMGPEERGAVLLAGAALVFGLRQRREEGGNHAAGGGGIEGLLASLKVEAGSAAASARGDSSSEPQQPQPQPEELAPVPASGLELGGYRGADDALLQSLERFGQAFPSLYEALIGERDRYLAWACKRSRAVNGAPRVVAVMGALHLPGVVATMREDNGGDTLNFKDVAKLPPIYGPLAAETNTWGNGGVALSPGTRRLLGRAAGRWAVTGLPRLARDVAVGTVAVEGLKLGYAQAAPQLEGWWTEVVGGLPPLPFLLS